MAAANQQLTDSGRESLDSTPIARTVRVRPTVSTFEDLRRMYAMLREESARQGFETPEEADDFDVEDDPEPVSRYEHDFAHRLDAAPVADITDPPPPHQEKPSKAPPAPSDDKRGPQAAE